MNLPPANGTVRWSHLKARFGGFTGKTKVKCAAIVFFLSSCAGYVVNVSPEYQDKVIQNLQAILPESHRATVGHVAHLITALCGAYCMIKSSHLGPQSPEQNGPDDK